MTCVEQTMSPIFKCKGNDNVTRILQLQRHTHPCWNGNFSTATTTTAVADTPWQKCDKRDSIELNLWQVAFQNIYEDECVERHSKHPWPLSKTGGFIDKRQAKNGKSSMKWDRDSDEWSHGKIQVLGCDFWYSERFRNRFAQDFMTRTFPLDESVSEWVLLSLCGSRFKEAVATSAPCIWPCEAWSRNRVKTLDMISFIEHILRSRQRPRKFCFNFHRWKQSFEKLAFVWLISECSVVFCIQSTLLLVASPKYVENHLPVLGIELPDTFPGETLSKEAYTPRRLSRMWDNLLGVFFLLLKKMDLLLEKPNGHAKAKIDCGICQDTLLIKNVFSCSCGLSVCTLCAEQLEKANCPGCSVAWPFERMPKSFAKV